MPEKIDQKSPLVRIKPIAYLKMLKHVLRFGSRGLNKTQWKECMGMLMGTLGTQKGEVYDVNIIDAVPMTHGTQIDVSFNEYNYVTFAEINEKYADEGLFNVGWYHSHPGLTPFLSQVDVKNQLGYQSVNPSAIAIVWDHTLLEKEDHFGFEVYRLSEMEKLERSGYKTVQFIIEPPDSLDFFRTAIKEIIDLQQNGNPPMFEMKELPGLLGTESYNPLIFEDAVLTIPTFFQNISEIPVKIGNTQISSKITPILYEYFNNWVKEFLQRVRTQNGLYINNFSKLTETFEQGIKQIQLWFMNETYEELSRIYGEFEHNLNNKLIKVNTDVQTLQEAFIIDKSKENMMNLSVPELITQLDAVRNTFISKLNEKRIEGRK